MDRRNGPNDSMNDAVNGHESRDTQGAHPGPADHAVVSDHLPRKERERAMHREEILRAAERLLANKSYGDIRVEEIAAESEFSVGYIYKIFPSKEDIYVTLIEQTSHDLIGIIDREISSNASFEDRLSNLVRSVFTWLGDNPAFTANHINELYTLTRTLPRLKAAHAEEEQIIRNKATALFEDGVRSGVIEGDIEVMTRTLRALVWGLIGEDILHGTKTGRWKEYPAIVVRVFLRAFAPERGDR